MAQKSASPNYDLSGVNPMSLIDVVILCGGLGTRLRSLISDRPKGLADIKGKPLLHIVVENLLSHGFRRLIFAIGHKKEQIIEYFDNTKFPEYIPYEIEYSPEKRPLGTGGALKLALLKVKSENYLVINGDCLYNVDFNRVYSAHCKRNALATLTLVKVLESSPYGAAILASDNKLKAFSEKLLKGANFVSAGVYFMNKKISAYFPNKKIFSLENDVFPTLYNKEFYGYPIKGSFYDIGVPERYLKAHDYLQ